MIVRKLMLLSTSLVVIPSWSFVSISPTHRSTRLGSSLDIEYQSDESKYGRGEMHLSAVLDTGDIVVYQTGTWYVDGVEVGDGGPPKFHYGLVETIQLVWTHNCEHGVIRALPLKLAENGNQLVLESEECIEFGPEQLVAKLPLEWDETEQLAASSLELSDELWLSANPST